MLPFILAAVGGYLIGDSIGEDKKILEFAEGGTIELYYVQDANGNVKNISKSYEDADRFLEKSLKFNGDIRVAIVPKEDWEKEKVSISNIKRYEEGGNINMDETEIDIDKEGDVIKVYYVKGDIGFDGRLRKYNSGRADEYEFEVSYFDDEESEAYYDANWESIEAEILNKFYNNK